MYTYTYVCVYEQIYKYTHMYMRVACVFAAAHNILLGVAMKVSKRIRLAENALLHLLGSELFD